MPGNEREESGTAMAVMLMKRHAELEGIAAGRRWKRLPITSGGDRREFSGHAGDGERKKPWLTQ